MIHTPRTAAKALLTAGFGVLLALHAQAATNAPAATAKPAPPAPALAHGTKTSNSTKQTAATASKAQPSTAPATAAPVLSPASAPSRDPNKVELSQSLPTTMEEIATVDVLREVCPALLDGSQQKAFQQGLIELLKTMLPGLPNPLLALDSLKTDTAYQPLYAQARAQTAQSNVTDNRAVCRDILTYAPSSASANTSSKTKKR